MFFPLLALVLWQNQGDRNYFDFQSLNAILLGLVIYIYIDIAIMELG